MAEIVGASEGERSFIGVNQIAAAVKSVRNAFDFPIFLNAYHTHSRACEEVARAGFDSIVFDLSALPLEQNVRLTREAVAALKAINPSMLVEGEIGDIGGRSEIHETMSTPSGTSVLRWIPSRSDETPIAPVAGFTATCRKQ
jgi:fructose-bisphosphate aldolase class II